MFAHAAGPRYRIGVPSQSFARLKYYFNRCKPDEPIPAEDTERFYVDFDGMNLRGERCVDTLASTIALASRPTCQLLTGFAGSGKSSELLRLRARLEAEDFFVVYANATETLGTQNRIEYSDLLIQLGLAVDTALKEMKGRGAREEWVGRFGREIKELLLRDITLGGAKIDLPGTKIGAELKENFEFRLALRKAANSRRRQLLQQTRSFFEDADQFVVKQDYAGLVVILDDLEKLSQADEVQRAARSMFLHHADALRTPAVHIIYTVPVRLVFSGAAPELGKLYDGEPQVLPMVKMRTQDSGEPFVQGHHAMQLLLERRLDLDEVFGPDLALMQRLIASSGGYIRDLLRMIQYALQNTQELPLSEENVASAIAKLRRSYVRAYSTSYEALLQYIDTKRPEIIPDDLGEHLEDVLASHLAMVYGNDIDWYDIHPLLRDVVQA